MTVQDITEVLKRNGWTVRISATKRTVTVAIHTEKGDVEIDSITAPTLAIAFNMLMSPTGVSPS